MPSDGYIAARQEWWERLVKRKECPDWQIVAFENADCLIEYWEPKVPDTQNRHDRDEVYVIVAGGADFDLNGDLHSVFAGDLIFVPAGMSHRFVRRSSDLALWILLFGVNKRDAEDDSTTRRRLRHLLR